MPNYVITCLIFIKRSEINYCIINIGRRNFLKYLLKEKKVQTLKEEQRRKVLVNFYKNNMEKLACHIEKLAIHLAYHSKESLMCLK